MTDVDHVVLELDRGSRGKLRVSRSVYKDSLPFTKIQSWYPDGDGTDAVLKPGKTVTIKDHELAQLIGVLIKIDKRQFLDKVAPPAARPPQHRTIRASAVDDEKGLF